MSYRPGGISIIHLVAANAPIEKTDRSLASWPIFDPSFFEESSYDYPISFNGKMRYKLGLSLSLTKEEVEMEVLKNEKTKKLLAEKEVKRVIVVPGKIVNIVV